MKPLRQAIEDYIGLRRSLGFKLRRVAEHQSSQVVAPSPPTVRTGSGGEIIRDVNENPSLRKRTAQMLVLQVIHLRWSAHSQWLGR